MWNDNERNIKMWNTKYESVKMWKWKGVKYESKFKTLNMKLSVKMWNEKVWSTVWKCETRNVNMWKCEMTRCETWKCEIKYKSVRYENVKHESGKMWNDKVWNIKKWNMKVRKFENCDPMNWGKCKCELWNEIKFIVILCDEHWPWLLHSLPSVPHQGKFAKTRHRSVGWVMKDNACHIAWIFLHYFLKGTKAI